ncbi:HAMP domain-containing sensor histidine kinase [Mangrovicoccus sp. HB161399]|uniref:sensor histidine kinase n=1 Tax=Mangrovicoccus sp. HB161399 TaxID=2720392 RepID=UPI0015559125|nr:HAMP domain-containing sensor histidine kinase [Mangrovicoccus sp. HB161399]
MARARLAVALGSGLTSGAAFRGALYGIAAFCGVLFLSGIAVLATARHAVRADIEAGLAAQLAIVQEMAAASDAAAFDATVTDLARRFAAANLVVAVYHGNDVVAANAALPRAPDTWRIVSDVATIRGEELDRVLVLTGRAGPYTVVLGRDMGGVTRVSHAIAGVLAAVGLVVVATLIAIGWVLSARSERALGRIEAALDLVSRGEFGARAPEAVDPDQIDRVAAKINIHLDRLELLMAEARNRAAAIAHDLRTPLARAILTAERLLAEVGAGPGAEEAAELAEELDRLARIFDAILRIARIEGAQGALPEVPADLGRVLAEVADLYEAAAEAQGQTLAASGHAAVRGDATLLTQAAANLAANAVAHAGPGAAIRLEAGLLDGCAVLACLDDGPGIPEAERTRVLDPFVRLDAAAGGTGLGLTFVRAVAERHGAELRLSDGGPGLRAEIVFPRELTQL